MAANIGDKGIQRQRNSTVNSQEERVSPLSQGHTQLAHLSLR